MYTYKVQYTYKHNCAVAHSYGHLKVNKNNADTEMYVPDLPPSPSPPPPQVSSRPCHWIRVVENSMIWLSGSKPHPLYHRFNPTLQLYSVCAHYCVSSISITSLAPRPAQSAILRCAIPCPNHKMLTLYCLQLCTRVQDTVRLIPCILGCCLTLWKATV